MDHVAEDLEARRDRAAGEAVAVLDAQSMMARDPGLRTMVADAIKGGKTPVYAVDESITHFRQMLEDMGGYMAERAADLIDLRNRMVARLLHLPMPGIPDQEEPFVLLAEDLAPADTVDLDPERILALVTEKGGPTSHTAIIAKSLGLPAIVSCGGALDLEEGTTVIADGSTGIVTVSPTDDQISAAQRRQEERAKLLASSSGPGRTADGHAVKLLLNVGNAEPAGEGQTRAGDVDAEGVGLFRTEFLFLDRTEEPTVEEQTASYRRLFETFGGRRVVVRTLDVGADKPLPFVDPGPGDNPALGLRGWRLRELEPGIIDRQLEALAAAAEDAPCEVWTMAPMVSTVDEAAGFVERAHSIGLSTAGVMVEVPSMAIQARNLVEVVDFVSIGTNDLSQYTFAADRLVGELGELLDPWQPAVLDLVARVGAAGREADVPAGVCGEAASDPLLARVLVGMGITSLSMSAPAVAEVRISLAGASLDACRAAAEAALAAADPADARRLVYDTA